MTAYADEGKNQNPIIEKSPYKNLATPFDKIKTEHFLPAIKAGIEVARKKVAEIVSQSEEPSFKNTVLALEEGSEVLDYAESVFHCLNGTDTNEEMMKIAREASALRSQLATEITTNSKLFERVKAVFEKRTSLGLTTEEKTLLENEYFTFTRNGALLSESDKEKLKAIDAELSQLSPKYSENVLKFTNENFISIEKKDLDGMPAWFEKTAEQAAVSRKVSGYALTLDAPVMIPFMQYSPRRDLREKLWRLNGSKCLSGSYQNTENVSKLVNLRLKRAQLLGFKSHADYVLQRRMAETPETVKKFISEIRKHSVPACKNELAEIKAAMKADIGTDDLKPWDLSYYSEKVRKQKFDIDQEALRPYFKSSQVLQGAFDLAFKLYSLRFRPISDIPKYHPEVECFEVWDEVRNVYMGIFYVDLFPRTTKRGGAWATAFYEQGQRSGKPHRPHISIVCNFTKPTEGRPSLLTFDEVRTLFHEFGHALHGMLSDCKYRSTGGFNVFWDFVELPSQFMENWVLVPEVLNTFAKHFETGEPIPKEMIEKLKKSSTFMSGYQSMRQLAFANLDMAWHGMENPFTGNVVDFEIENSKDFRIFDPIENTNSSVSFSHIFAGGYSSGYYSYKWAEVLEADAFAKFKETGFFDRAVSQSFRENILSKGGSDHPMTLFKKFRGREPDVKALLEREGLLEAAR